MGYKAYFATLLTELVEKAVRHYGERLCFIILFGSVARDQHSPESDVDLLVVLQETKGNYREFTEFYENVEAKLDTIENMKRAGMNPRINPIFHSCKTLSVELPYLWGGGLRVLYQKGTLGDAFVAALQEYVRKFLRKREEPMEYLEVVDGQQKARSGLPEKGPGAF